LLQPCARNICFPGLELSAAVPEEGVVAGVLGGVVVAGVLLGGVLLGGVVPAVGVLDAGVFAGVDEAVAGDSFFAVPVLLWPGGVVVVPGVAGVPDVEGVVAVAAEVVSTDVVVATSGAAVCAVSDEAGTGCVAVAVVSDTDAFSRTVQPENASRASAAAITIRCIAMGLLLDDVSVFEALPLRYPETR
jgi:hypothetical protein